jgi:O-antigen/teichoic acid export membrane protein
MAITIVQGILLVPLYLKYISVGTYGAWLATGGILGVLSTFDAGVGLVATQKLAAAANGKEWKTFASITANSFAVTSLIAVVVFLLATPLALLAPIWFGCPTEDVRELAFANMFVALRLPLAVLMFTAGAVPQALQQPLASGLFILGGQIFGVIATAGLLLFGFGVIALGIGQLAIPVLTLAGYAFLVPALFRRYSIPPSWPALLSAWELLKESAWLFISKLSNLLADNIEPTLVAAASTPNLAASFTQSSRLPQIIPALQARIGSAAFSGLAQLTNSDRIVASPGVADFLTFSLSFLLFNFTIAFLYTKDFISIWLSPALFCGNLAFTFILLNALFAGLREPLTNLLIASGNSSIAGRVLTAGPLARILFLAIAIPTLGPLGVPAAFSAASLLLTALFLNVFIKKEGKFIKTLVGLSAPALLASLLTCLATGLLLPQPSTLWALFLNISITSLFWLAIFCLANRAFVTRTITRLFFKVPGITV